MQREGSGSPGMAMAPGVPRGLWDQGRNTAALRQVAGGTGHTELKNESSFIVYFSELIS